MKATSRARFHAFVRFWNNGINRHILKLIEEQESIAARMTYLPCGSTVYERMKLAYAIWDVKIELWRSFIIESNASLNLSGDEQE
jgi:hypothetical protein